MVMESGVCRFRGLWRILVGHFWAEMLQAVVA